MGHGFACENTGFNPGWLHTGEDIYSRDGSAAGAGVYAVADGEIVYAGGEYPGLVAIVQHAPDLYSMYGHLDYALAVESGGVERGQLLGTVLDFTDGQESHAHFEIRTFLMTAEINGDAPRYGAGCSFQCTPGPGYWPIDAPEHPAAMGWRNPTHVIANRAYDGAPPDDAEVIVASGSDEFAALWSAPSDGADAERVGELPLTAGDRYRLDAIATAGSVAGNERRRLPALVPHRRARSRSGMSAGSDTDAVSHRVGWPAVFGAVRFLACRRGRVAFVPPSRPLREASPQIPPRIPQPRLCPPYASRSSHDRCREPFNVAYNRQWGTSGQRGQE